MDVTEFLRTSYTAYHAVANCRRMLDEAGFAEVSADDMPRLQAGNKCYAVQGGTSIFAFVVGDKPQLMLAESHTDSPSLHLKGAQTLPSTEGNRLNVEKYGGLLLYSMLDIPLKVAGRIVYATETGVQEELVASAGDVCIPSLCIHHNPDANNLSLNVQNDMLPLVGQADDVWQWLAPERNVLDADLYAVPDVAPYRWGDQAQFLSSPRIDNLTSVYTSITALIAAKPTGLAMAACFDNEEIGSGTQRGAASAYLADLLAAIYRACGYTDYKKAVRQGLALSIDNGHAAHPAHPEKSDVVPAPVMGGGVVIKHHVNYATNGLSAGIFKRMLDIAGIARQDYYNRSDIGCGSTLGNIAARALTIDTVDIGIAQLAMHSAVETAAWSDIDTMSQAISTFFACDIDKQAGAVQIRV